MNITVGEIITMIVMVIGFLLQYIDVSRKMNLIVVNFSERITKLEIHKEHLEKEIRYKHEEIEKDLKYHVDAMFHDIKKCEAKHGNEA